MQFNYTGRATVDRTTLDYDLRDLEIGVVGGNTILYGTTGPAGGLVAYSISNTGGLLQALDFQFFTGAGGQGSGGFAELAEINGQVQLLFGGDADDGVFSFGVSSSSGILTQLTSGLSLSGPVDRLTDVVSTTINGDNVLYVADADLGRITVYSQSGTSSYTSIDIENVGQGDMELAFGQAGGSQYLISTDLEANHIAAYRIDAQGRLTQTYTMGATDGLGVAAPTAVEVIEAHGQTWVVLGAAGSGSLSVMQLNNLGQLIPTDHVLDTLDTRFDDVTAIKTVSANGWTFVIAGGADDGMTLFTLTPSGKLIHLDTIIHDIGLGLENVTAFEAVFIGDQIQIFVTSGTSAGVSQFSVSLSDLGDVISGTGALSGTSDDDLLIASDGTTSLTGGNGADIFVVEYFDQTVRIEDFSAGQDRLDLSAFPMLYDPSRLTVTSTPNGITLSYGVATVEILSDDGLPLTLDDVFPQGFDWANHLSIFVDLPDTDGANVIDGSNGNDMLVGTSGEDAIWGGRGSDTVDAGEGNDLLNGGQGNDMLDGCSGVDTVQYFNSSVNYTMLRSGNVAVIYDQVGDDGVDATYNIEEFAFTDQTMAASEITEFGALSYIASHADLTNVFGANTALGLSHYITNGMAEGRTITFGGMEYIASYDVLIDILGADAEAGAQHFIEFGRDVGWSATFSGLQYIASYPILVEILGNDAEAGAQHYIEFGRAVGWAPTFSGLQYIASYDILIDIFGADAEAGVQHYVEFGYEVGWAPSFASYQYIASYDVLIDIFGADAEAGAQHYIEFGRDAGWAPTFNSYQYIASYDILIDIFGTDAEAGAKHYIEFGRDVGWAPSFTALQYIASYEILMDIFGTDAEAGAKHYIEFGRDVGWEPSFRGMEYIASYDILIDILGADAEAGAAHFIEFGRDAGWTQTFSGLEYIASYAPLIQILGPDAEAGAKHYIEYGRDVGWEITFSGLDYLASHTDLLKILGGDGEAAALHYIMSGVNEGRATNLRGDLDPITTSQTARGGNGLITGGDEAEILAGMGGDDTLIGGAADDVLVGGTDSDTFVFSDGFDNDIIADFDALDVDERIDLSDVSAITDYNDLVLNHLTIVDGVVTIVDGANTIALTDVILSDLDQSDFIF